MVEDNEIQELSRIKKAIDEDKNYWESIYNRAKEDQKIANGIDGSQFDKLDQKHRGKNRAEFQFPIIDKYIERILGNYNSSPYGIQYSALNSMKVNNAENLNGVVGGIETRSDAKSVYRNALRGTSSVGYGFIHVTTEYTNPEDDSLEVDVSIEHIQDYTSVIYDRLSVAVNGADARRASWVDYISVSEAKETYGDDVVKEAGEDALFDSGYLKNSEGDVVPVVVFYEKKTTSKTIYISSEGEVLEDKVEGARAKEKIETKVYVTKCVGNKIVLSQELKGLTYIPIIPVYGLPVFADGKTQYVGIPHRAKDAQKLINYAGSLGAERLALSPKANYIGSRRAVAPYLEQWKNSSKSNIPILVFEDKDPETGEMIAPPQKQDVSVNLGDVVSTQQNYLNILDQIVGMPEGGISGEGNYNETAEGALLRAKSAESVLSTFYENLASSIAQVGRVVLQMIASNYDTTRRVPVIENGRQVMKEIDFKELNLIPSEYDVSVESGPLLSTQRKDNLRSLLAISQLAGEDGKLFLPKIIESTDVADDDQYLQQTAQMIAQRVAQAGMPPQPQGVDPAQAQAMQQENEFLKNQIGMLNQEIIEARSSLQKEQIKSQTDILKTQMQNQNKIELQQMKIQGDVGLQAQEGQQEREQMLLEQRAELERTIAETDLELRNIQNSFNL